VTLSITDTGVGMPPDVLARVFEPFFTTKEIGRGTGLGLSMIYGFVKQSGGHIEIDSVVGTGTTVRLILPRARNVAAEAARLSPDAAGEAAPAKGHGEVVLVVEDDPDVRGVAVSTLETLG